MRDDATEEIVFAMNAQCACVIDADECARGDDIAPSRSVVCLIVVAGEPITLKCRDAACDLRACCMIVCRAVGRLAAVNDDLANGLRRRER